MKGVVMSKNRLRRRRLAVIGKHVIAWANPHFSRTWWKNHHHRMTNTLRTVWAWIKSRGVAFPQKTIVFYKPDWLSILILLESSVLSFQFAILRLKFFYLGRKFRRLALENRNLVFEHRKMLGLDCGGTVLLDDLVDKSEGIETHKSGDARNDA